MIRSWSFALSLNFDVLIPFKGGLYPSTNLTSVSNPYRNHPNAKTINRYVEFEERRKIAIAIVELGWFSNEGISCRLM